MEPGDAEPAWHREVISGEVAATLAQLRDLRALDAFYLAGGTGLALALGHRRSLDLDFFTPRPFEGDPLLGKIEHLPDFSLAMRDHETIHAAIAGVKVSFHGGRGPLHGCAAPPACAHADLGAPRPQAGAALRGGRAEFASRGRAAPRNFAAFRAGFARRQSGATPAIGYRYPLLFPTRPFMEVAVAQPREIACMRISAIASRGTKRDFVDLYFVAQTHGLRALFRHFAAKYAQTNYSPLHIAKSLTFFEDAEKDPMPDMLAVCDWAVVKQYFSHEAPRLL